jgi:hypothetical protein
MYIYTYTYTTFKPNPLSLSNLELRTLVTYILKVILMSLIILD